MTATISNHDGIHPIVSSLREARERKGLSQRALSELAGMSQANISRIENGRQDLRLSNLIELARVLDLELVLVPRTRMAAVSALMRSAEGDPGRLPPAYRLGGEE